MLHTRRRKKTHIRFLTQWPANNNGAYGNHRVDLHPLCTVLIGNTHTDTQTGGRIEKGRTEVVCCGYIAGK